MENTVKKTPIPISNKKAKLSLIHIAKKDTGISDKDYRDLLLGAAGIDSAASLEYEYQFTAVMNAFEKLGFTSWKKQGKTTGRPRRTDAWGSTEDQRAKIEAMWKTCARDKSDRALRAFIKRITHVDHPAFLRPPLAQKVIVALEVMMRKAGFDPRTGGMA